MELNSGQARYRKVTKPPRKVRAALSHWLKRTTTPIWRLLDDSGVVIGHDPSHQRLHGFSIGSQIHRDLPQPSSSPFTVSSLLLSRSLHTAPSCWLTGGNKAPKAQCGRAMGWSQGVSGLVRDSIVDPPYRLLSRSTAHVPFSHGPSGERDSDLVSSGFFHLEGDFRSIFTFFCTIVHSNLIPFFATASSTSLFSKTLPSRVLVPAGWWRFRYIFAGRRQSLPTDTSDTDDTDERIPADFFPIDHQILDTKRRRTSKSNINL
ncbi:uncharacterized protein CLUP02_08625 [Colletotrichum lupini]|uniref:Uncharacterized protein n=1 Tax=Colletotrichum lupini TaxID=145971 RepID=A0A9Q8SV31_9PEZI|nr:uncharacterized protein CLUP02_08625 [Colletotrichum lupini]UQC83132.1 hypothetical protein CLUP02_08625 [Colletotrichum lupini]